MNGYNLISGAFQLKIGNYADYWEFASHMNKLFVDIPYSNKAVNERIKQITNDFCGNNSINGQNAAFNKLVVKDLINASNKLDSVPSVEVFHQRIGTAYNETLRILSEFNIKIESPLISIIDKFPRPYEDMDWIAFAPDKSDYDNFGITPGIYLLENELCPYYSELIVSHELIHFALGIKSPNLLGRGLEEGIAELFGTLYIGSKLYSSDIAKNVFINARYGNSSSNSNLLYLDYTRQAALIYKRYGLKGISQLIREGREAIKLVECHLLNGNLNKIKLEKGNFDRKLSLLVDDLLYGYVPHLTVSPITAYIASHIRVGMNVDDISKATDIDGNIVQSALDELQTKTFTILVDNNTVIFSDIEIVERCNALRYEVIYTNEQ